MTSTLVSAITGLPGWNLSMLVLLAKATLILIAALGTTLVMQRSSAGARHLVWLATLGMLLLVPALTAWGPLRVGILPPAASPSAVAASGIVTTPTLEVTTAPSPNPVLSGGTATKHVAGAGWTGGADANATASPPRMNILSRLGSMSAFSMVLGVWALIVMVLAAWLGYGALAVNRIVRRARPLDTKDWLAPLWEVSDRFALDEPPRLLRSDDAKMPFACGLLTPTIVLPAECDNWTADRRLAVLLHELAHVRRHDLLGHTLGRVACALYWFHPLVWTAAKQLRAESERACDDLALLCGARASDYAEHLLDIVTSVRHDSTPAVALAMARRKEFEGRMLAILDPELQHSSPSRWQSAALIGSLAVVAVIVGAAAPTQRVEARTVQSATAAENSPSKGAVQSAQQTAQQGVPKATKPRAPEYPNSGVPGVASKAERMIEQATQVTRTTESTQTLVDTHTTYNKSTSTNVNPGKLLDEKSMGDIGGIAARSMEKIAQQKGSPANALRSPDDRPILLANVLRNDTSASLRRIAAWGLSEYADQQVATDALATALRRDSNAGVREMAAWALGEGDDRNTSGTAALTAALRSDADVKVRATAAWALGQVGDQASTEALAAALSDSDESVRMRAAWALGQVSPRQAPRALVAMLQNRDPRMREVTAWALYEIEDPSAAPALNAALKTETDKNLQIAYIRALAAMGEKSVDALRGLLESKDQQVRSMAIRALAGGHAAGPWPWPWPEPRPWP